MKHVSFEEYEAAKAEIIGGVHYIEKSTMENDVIHKTYSTEENGTFYEVNDQRPRRVLERQAFRKTDLRRKRAGHRNGQKGGAGLRRFAGGENQSERRRVEADRL